MVQKRTEERPASSTEEIDSRPSFEAEFSDDGDLDDQMNTQSMPDLTPEDGTNETESAEMDDDEQCFTNIFNDPEIQEQPIYSGASINRGQLLCLILAFILKHSICGSGLKDLLDLLNIVAPGCAPTN
ncbi:unnamed protein product [Arctogadus glacialis]